MKLLEHVSGAIGTDEAGRGPLAGPVVAAAVRIPDGFDLRGITDSKKLTPMQRETAAERILAGCECQISLAEPPEIDEVNILWASMAAMERAVFALPSGWTRLLVDGNRLPRAFAHACFAGRVEAVIKGDGRYACIAAASIVAKVHRDQLMKSYATTYPAYGFDRHFGYPTPDHLEALRSHGPCPIHRRSFGPVADALAVPKVVAKVIAMEQPSLWGLADA